MDSVTASPSAPSAGQQVVFSAVVRNTGSGPTTGNYRVLFSIDGAAATWATDSIGPLAAGATRTVTATSSAAGGASWSAVSGAHTVTAKVNDTLTIPETDVTNNNQNLTLTVSGATGGTTAGSNIGNPTDFAGYRDGTNTGYQAVYDPGLGRTLQLSDLTVYTGSLTFTGGTFFRQFIKGAVTVNADTTFNQCYFEGPDGSSSKTGHFMFQGSGKVTMTDCEVNGLGQSGPDAAPYPSGYGYESVFHTGMAFSLTRCNLYGCTDILKQGNGCYVGYSWLHGNIHYYSAPKADTHSDHFQPATGSCSNFTMEYCTLGTPKSIAMVAGSDWTQYEQMINCGHVQLGAFNSGATVTNFNMLYCYANDGNRSFQGSGNSAATISGLFSGNRVGPHFRYDPPWGVSAFTLAAVDGTTFTFDGTNVIDDNFVSFHGTTYTKDQVFW